MNIFKILLANITIDNRRRHCPVSDTHFEKFPSAISFKEAGTFLKELATQLQFIDRNLSKSQISIEDQYWSKGRLLELAQTSSEKYL
jgi:hypothetical protein